MDRMARKTFSKGNKNKNKNNPKEMKLAKLDVDEFMRNGLNSDSDSDDTSQGSDSDNSLEETSEISKSHHKKSLDRLKKLDPEFYEFLEKEEKSLLEFEGSSDEASDDDDSPTATKRVATAHASRKVGDGGDPAKASKGPSESQTHTGKKRKNEESSQSESEEEFDEFDNYSSDDSDDNGVYHQLPEKLEVASDSEEDDEIDTDDSKVSVTKQMIKIMTKELQEGSVLALKKAFSVFRAAAQQISDDKEKLETPYRIEGSSIFNAVIRMCLAEVPPSLQKVLNLPELTDFNKPPVPSKNNKKWMKIRSDMKFYIQNLVQLMTALAESSMINIILKHLHKLLVYCTTFPKLAKLILKKLIQLWSRGEETTRVVAFLCINRLVRLMNKEFIEFCMKQMYMSYVKNVKFTSPTTLPLINFMQHSIVEIFSINHVTAYQYSFVYIRQLAIHLRNAITIKRKENCQAVYNWQFVHCLGLWVRLLSLNSDSEVLSPLIYPLTQTIIGTIKLIPTVRYYPLRFHCVEYLNMLSKSTNTFIPVLPFLLEIFEQVDFKKKHKAASFKPLNFACMLKLSNTQLEEKGFKDGVIDQMYALLLEQFNIHSHSIGFPELALPAVIQIKDFLKKCKIANYCKQIKQILDKVEESSRFIVNRRKSSNVQLADSKAVESWERSCKVAGTPLGKFYETWRKLRDKELQHEIAGKERIVGMDDLPLILRPSKPQKATEDEKKEFAALFDSDSDESMDDQTRFLLKEEKSKLKQPVAKKKKVNNGGSDSDYSDLDSDELEQLAGSADEDSDDGSAGPDDNESDSGNINNDDEDSDDESGSDLDDMSDEGDIVEDFRMSSDSD